MTINDDERHIVNRVRPYDREHALARCPSNPGVNPECDGGNDSGDQRGEKCQPVYRRCVRRTCGRRAERRSRSRPRWISGWTTPQSRRSSRMRTQSPRPRKSRGTSPSVHDLMGKPMNFESLNPMSIMSDQGYEDVDHERPVAAREGDARATAHRVSPLRNEVMMRWNTTTTTSTVTNMIVANAAPVGHSSPAT